MQALPKRTLTKGGEYDYHTFGYNQLHSGGTACACFLLKHPYFFSIENNVIPPQLLQMTIKVMLVPNHGPQPARENDRERFELLGIITSL